MYIDLLAREDDQIVVTDVAGRDISAGEIVRVVDLLNKGFQFLANFPIEVQAKLQEYKTRIEAYNFSLVTVREVSIDVATEIFTRINVSGKPLSVFEIMVAKTFDASKGFDLAEQYAQMIEKLQSVDYDTIPSSVLLQAVSSVLVSECSKKHILKLDKQEFIEVTPQVINAIYASAEYFRNYFRIPVSRLLPYSALLVPFTYFFYKHKNRPLDNKKDHLQDLFWRTSLAGRYSHSLESRIAQDIKRIDIILSGATPDYDYSIDISAEFIRQNGWFTATRSFVKAILCLLAYHQPKSFADNSHVRISNDWLLRANSKNYHHFFPRGHLKKQHVSEHLVNHVANITIVDDFLNKRAIRARPPSNYMADFAKNNPELKDTMATHLISLDESGIWEDDYSMFLQRRCVTFSSLLSERIISREIDRLGQPVDTADFSDEEEQAFTGA